MLKGILTALLLISNVSAMEVDGTKEQMICIKAAADKLDKDELRKRGILATHVALKEIVISCGASTKPFPNKFK